MFVWFYFAVFCLKSNNNPFQFKNPTLDILPVVLYIASRPHCDNCQAQEMDLVPLKHTHSLQIIIDTPRHYTHQVSSSNSSLAPRSVSAWAERESHVFRRRALHLPGGQPPHRGHHTRRAQPPRETQRHEPCLLEVEGSEVIMNRPLVAFSYFSRLFQMHAAGTSNEELCQRMSTGRLWTLGYITFYLGVKYPDCYITWPFIQKSLEGMRHFLQADGLV